MAAELNPALPSGAAPETGLAAAANQTPAETAPAGWVLLYTPGNRPRYVPQADVERAMREEGMRLQPYDLEQMLAAFNATMRDTLDAVPKAIAELIATDYAREEDVLILRDAITKTRDSIADLLFAAGLLLPTEADVAAMQDYLDETPRRLQAQQQVATMHAAGEVVPVSLEKFAQGVPGMTEKIEAHRHALASLPRERLEARRARSAADDAAREAAAANQLRERVRFMQIAGYPVELQGGQVMRRHPKTGALYPADQNMAAFLPPRDPETGDLPAVHLEEA